MPSTPLCSIPSSTSLRHTWAPSNSASPQRTLVCNRTGAAVARSVNLDAQYWRRHARQPVDFAKGVRTLAELGCTVLLEVGPQPVLTAAALRAWPNADTRPEAIASLRRKGADRSSDQRSRRVGLRGRPSSRLHPIPTRTGPQAGPAPLPIPASQLLVYRGSPHPGRTDRRRAHRDGPTPGGRPARGTGGFSRRSDAARTKPSLY